MALNTFEEVKAALRSWSERSDLTDQLLEQVIKMTEVDVSSRLRVPAMEALVELEVSNGSVQIPLDYLELRRLQFEDNQGGPTVLQYLPWDQFILRVNEQSNNSCWYSRQGPLWYLAGVPEDLTTVTCYYHTQIPSIDDVNPTNWLLQVSPQSYLYGGLQYIYDYVMQGDRAAYWGEKLLTEINKLQAMGDAAEHRGTLLAVRTL